MQPLQKFTYLGIDETGLGAGNGSVIVVAAQTHDKRLTLDTDRCHAKAKDILERAKAYSRKEQTLDFGMIPSLPSYAELQANGLVSFLWTRAKGGRFPRQIIEHASIAQVVAANGFDAKKTVLFIDAFHGRMDESIYLIKESLHQLGFRIHYRHIHLVSNGDRRIEIVNYADLLAFQIGLLQNEKYLPYLHFVPDIPMKPNQIEYEINRVYPSPKPRERLEGIINKYRALERIKL